jgi:hypothetical protein
MGRLDRSPRANWVENRGGLPDYIDRIAVHLNEKGMPISQAIAVAINAVKKACATGDLNFPGMQNENAGSRAEACAAVAQWEAMKTHKSSHPRGEGLELASPCTGCNQGEPLALASWNSMLHPRVPAGQAGGGKFASGTGGSKAKGSKGGKGAKGGKGTKASQAAAAKAQAKIVYSQFLKMNPQQRSAFLAKLSDPQLKALLSVASQGNSNDPSTKAALISIKDQMAARSLTGAKGPTAINQAKAASAAKSAASKQASAQKKTAGAAKSAASKQASAAKKQTAAQATAARKQLAAAKAAAAAQAKAQKTAVANQAAALKAQAALKAPTQKAQVAGLTSALKATSNPAQQAQILAQLKKALGLAQTASVADVLALATDGHQYRHGWVRIDGETPPKGAPKLPAPVAHASILSVTKSVQGRRAHAAKLSDGTLKATDNELSKRATAYGKDGQVVAHHRVVKEELAKRAAAADPKNKTLDPATLKAAIKALDAKKKSGQITSVLHAQQRAKLIKQLGKAQTIAGRKPTRLAAETGAALRLGFMPNTGSGDGPDITVNAGLKSPRDVRMAVAGHGKVPPHRQAAYRKRVAVAAKAMGPAGMRHVPPAWMKE